MAHCAALWGFANSYSVPQTSSPQADANTDHKSKRKNLKGHWKCDGKSARNWPTCKKKKKKSLLSLCPYFAHSVICLFSCVGTFCSWFPKFTQKKRSDIIMMSGTFSCSSNVITESRWMDLYLTMASTMFCSSLFTSLFRCQWKHRLLLSLIRHVMEGYDVYPETSVSDSMQDVPVCAVAAGYATGYSTIGLESNQEKQTDWRRTTMQNVKRSCYGLLLLSFFSTGFNYVGRNSPSCPHKSSLLRDETVNKSLGGFRAGSQSLIFSFSTSTHFFSRHTC